MSRLMTVLAVLAWLGNPAISPGDGLVPQRASRVVEGRVLDDQGRPPRLGKVMIGPVTPPIPYPEASIATLDANGRFRVELTEFRVEGESIGVGGLLRYQAIAEGCRPESGRIAPGVGPDRLDLKLMVEPWKTTELRMIDRLGQPVAGVEVTLAIGGTASPWSKLRSNAEGRCSIASAPGLGFLISTRLDGYLPTASGFRGTADDPALIKIPLLAAIQGRVVDPAGKPLSGIRVGRTIAPNPMASDPEARKRVILYPLVGTKQPATTDDQGRFTLTPLLRLESRSISRSGDFRFSTQTLCVTDPTYRQLTFLSLDLKNVPPLLEVTLRPTRLVQIPIEHEVAIPSGEIASWWELTYRPDPARPETGLPVMAGSATPRPAGGEEVAVSLPAGSYRIKITSTDAQEENRLEESERDLVVPPGEGPLPLPAIRLTATGQHRLVGQPAPEIDARDLDTGQPVRLADFRGKVVVLDFWGYWCGPCVGSMPELAEVSRRFRDKPVAVLALHDQSIQTREQYDRKLSTVKASTWNNQDLPFRVALDRPDPELAADHNPIGQGVTCKRYEIHGFPTTLVIDQVGRVSGIVNALEHGKVEAAIQSILDKKPDR